MMLTTIRSRMLVATLLPIVLIVLVLVGVFWANRLGELDQTHQQRGKLLLSQLAVSSEYGLFSGNLASLQLVVNGIKREADVRSVSVFDARGVLLVSAGAAPHQVLADALLAAAASAKKSDLELETLIQNVSFQKVPLDEGFGQSFEEGSAEPVPLGHAVLQLSRDGLHKRQQEMLQLALGVGLLGLLMAGFLAIQLGEGVVQPILRVSRMISQVGSGDLMARIRETPGDPLYDLQVSLNQMATQLAWGRDELEQRVANVTAELRDKKNEAEDATRAKTRFLAAASHDLRQPTHALGMFVARLSQLPLEGPVKQLVARVDESVRAMQDLLDDLLDVSRLDAGAVVVNLRPVAVGAVLELVAKALEPFAAEKGLRLKVRPTEVWVMTDAVLLHRMVMNLVHNALRYTDLGSVLVACRLSADGQIARLEVWDSGVGISLEHQTDIFREFYQVGNSGRDRAYGLGLGLNIVQRSATLLGHQLSVKSAPGRGSRFSISLPRAESAGLAAEAVGHEAPAIVSLQGTRVLLIEDDAFARTAVVELLESWGCTVYAGHTALAAMAAHERHGDWDVILSDYRLSSGDNGLLAIERLRAYAGRDVPAGLMSGDTDSALMQAAKDANLPLLHKPVRPAKLRSLLRRLTMASERPVSESA
ncbi:MAG: hybrid sensor histidine kinase/response regulator [Burkholderiales bacterium PBB3]|nr:MAG: hybrid sensor histidine kinase/response regulator [Burkholderiales bacterium PBB3]